MEYFQEKAINTFALKPKQWKRFVYDMNVIWPHKNKPLNDFLDHLNSRWEHMKSTMEIEENAHLPFLDVLITKNANGSLAHQVY